MSVPTTVNSDVYSTGKAEKITIEKSIDEIRKGNGYFVSNVITLAAGDISYILMRALSSPTIYHMSFKIASDSATEMWLYNGTGSTNTGAATPTRLMGWNLNRAAQTGSILFLQGVVTGASGTGSKIYSGYCPSYVVMKFGSSDARSNEFIINPLTSYLIGISGSGGRVGFEAYWYEQ